MYEFVVNPEGNNVFVNILYKGGTPEGAYNAKLLYYFDKNSFKRTLIGQFEYDSTRKGYITKKGKNPFADATRIRVMENGSAITPATPPKTQISTSTGTTNTTTTTTSTTAPVATTATNPAVEVEKKLRELYLAKNYDQVFSVSDDYLKNNPGTYLIYFHRYRTYFAQGKYQKTLDEIKIMENKKLADARIYCDAYAVSTVVKNEMLMNTYKNLA